MITVRLATLDDTSAITSIHKSQVTQWERVKPGGVLVPADYDDLSLYERWQHGGPWLSVETCAVHLNRLLAGSGIPLVAEVEEEVLAEAEVYESFEPAPFGHHLNVSVIMVHTERFRQGIGTALMRYILEMARLMKCERITVSHAEAREFYMKQGFRHTRSGRQIRIPTQEGRAFYQVTPLIDRSPDQIKGWAMPLGRSQSSRQEWEKLFPSDWAAGLPDMLEIPTSHLKLTVAGQNAIVFFQEAVESSPGEVNLLCWSARPLSGPLLTALRDKAWRDGYGAILSYIMDSDRGLLSPDIEQTDHTQDHLELAL